ncbi:hypothetical protein T484DRAFT_1885492, partial [Baffinella frigidus]
MANMALAPLHRSRTNVPMRERLHLHDGLRLMTADIAREHGWHLPHKSTADITRSTDELEDALYKAHDYAFRCGQQLTRAQVDINVEYERGGKADGLSFEDFLWRSRSIIADIYQEKEKTVSMSLDRLFEAYEDCRRGEVAVQTDLTSLKMEY